MYCVPCINIPCQCIVVPADGSFVILFITLTIIRSFSHTCYCKEKLLVDIVTLSVEAMSFLCMFVRFIWFGLFPFPNFTIFRHFFPDNRPNYQIFVKNSRNMLILNYGVKTNIARYQLLSF